MIPYKDLNPSRRFPFVTALVIAINVALFLYVILQPEEEAARFIYRFAAIPLEFKLGHDLSISPAPPPIFLSVFSAMFLHGGWLHLIGNMLYLWIFGNNIEDRMGPLRFFVFYILCGMIALFAQIYAGFGSSVPILGASGAIAGVLAAYLRLFPRAKIAVLVPIFYFFRTIVLPAWLVLGIWMLLQIGGIQLSVGRQGEAGGVAYVAHLGGFIAGLLLMPAFLKTGRRSR